MSDSNTRGSLNKSGIYALTCPSSGEIRYIGQSTNIQRRYASHCHSAGKPSRKKSHYQHWISSLKSYPGIIVLEECKDLDEAEKKHIADYKKAGHNLVNIAVGGEGYPEIPVYVLARKMKSTFGVDSSPYQMARSLIDAFKESDSNTKDAINNRCQYLMDCANG